MNRTKHAGVSDIGRVRPENQDRWFADPQAGLYVVADGMGGCAGGAVAAQVVVEVLPRLLRPGLERADSLTGPAARECVLAAIAELSDRLNHEARKQYGTAGVGSTVTDVIVGSEFATNATLLAAKGPVSLPSNGVSKHWISSPLSNGNCDSVLAVAPATTCPCWRHS